MLRVPIFDRIGFVCIPIYTYTASLLLVLWILQHAGWT